MRDDATRFDALVERYMKLGGADRRAVLASLTPSERDLFEREVAAARDTRRRARAQARSDDRQFVGYSPWLAAIIGEAIKGEAGPDRPRTGRCDEAIALAHRNESEQGDDEGGLLGRLLRQFGVSSAASREGGR